MELRDCTGEDYEEAVPRSQGCCVCASNVRATVVDLNYS